MSLHFFINRFIIFVAVIFMVLFTSVYAYSWNDASRFGTIEQLVNEGSFSIDGSIFWQTGDKVAIDGIFFSDKPPVLSVLAAAPYAVIHLFNIWLSEHSRVILYITNWFSMGIPFLLYWYVIYRRSKKHAVAYTSKESVLTLILALAGGTALFAYAGQLNNHLPAALLIGVVAVLLYDELIYKPKQLVLMGFLLSLAGVIDFGAIIIAFVLSILILSYAWYEQRSLKDMLKAGCFLALGATGPLLFHAWLTISITGDIFPGSMHPEFFDWPGSPFTQENLTGASLAVSSWKEWLAYVWYMFGFGYRGLLLHSPVIALGIVLSIAMVFNQQEQLQKRAYAFWSLVATAMLVLYYSLFGKDGGGIAYTVRWLIIVIPLFVPFLIQWAVQLRRRQYMTIGLCLLVLVGNLAAFGKALGGAYERDNYSIVGAIEDVPGRIHLLTKQAEEINERFLSF